MPKLELNVGWIGIGNMGQAILKRVIEKGVLTPEQATVCDLVAEKVAAVHASLGVPFVRRSAELLEKVDVLLYAAKPQNIPDIFPQIAEGIRQSQWVISIAAGVKTETLESYLPEGTPVVRVMPNIAALVGQAVSAIAPGEHAEEHHVAQTQMIFDAVGKTLRLEEKLLDVVTGLSGSGPAFLFLVMEALADAGVQLGLTYNDAVLLAEQTTLGAAQMALETGEHLSILRNRVTSPGGTTAAGLYTLESHALRAAFMDAVRAATQRATELGS